MANPLRINAVELLRRPGTERRVDVTTDVDELGIDDPRFGPGTPVHVDLRLEALTDGIVVTGTVTTRWQGTCRRCAAHAEGEMRSEIDELYQTVPTDPDAFELGEQLDLVPMVREVLLLDAPSNPLHREDCAGLCAVCGVDLNTASDHAPHDSPADPRWAALRDWQA